MWHSGGAEQKISMKKRHKRDRNMEQAQARQDRPPSCLVDFEKVKEKKDLAELCSSRCLTAVFVVNCGQRRQV